MEKSFGVENIKYIVGIDEVGRGPLAGPVAVCAFMCEPGFLDFLPKKKGEKNYIRDSKKMTRKQREKWYGFLNKKRKEGLCDFAVTFVSAENIDKFGIGKCILKALNKSLEKITTSDPALFQVYLDGGLKAPKEYIYQETIIHGDELHPVISLASIIAKVSRDKIMYRYAEEFPEYGFDKHVGYGTKAHYDAIAKHGQLPIHRKSFIH
jgi:ribonuclease HII